MSRVGATRKAPNFPLVACFLSSRNCWRKLRRFIAIRIAMRKIWRKVSLRRHWNLLHKQAFLRLINISRVNKSARLCKSFSFCVFAKRNKESHQSSSGIAIVIAQVERALMRSIKRNDFKFRRFNFFLGSTLTSLKLIKLKASHKLHRMKTRPQKHQPNESFNNNSNAIREISQFQMKRFAFRFIFVNCTTIKSNLFFQLSAQPIH